MFQVPLSSHRTLHLQTEKTNLNHSVHLHAASAGWFRIKINVQIGAGGCADRQGELAKDAQGCRAPHRTSPGTAAACGCKYQCEGWLLVLQVTAAHTGVGKGHLKLDLNLVSQRSPLGSAAHRDGLCTLSNTPKTTEPSPFSFSITFIHKEIRFKGQN